MAPDSLQCLHDEHHEAQVLLGRLAGSVQQHACVGGETPVVVLARAVDAGKRLLVQQHAETVVACHALHQLHQQHIVVHGQVAFFVDGGQLKLVGCHLVVARLHGYAQLQRLNLQILHEGLHALGDGTEVVVVHLLVLCRVVAHQRATGEHQVGAGRVETLVNQEVLLFPTQVGLHLLHLRIEQARHVGGSHVHGVQGSQQRSLIVEGLARVGNEDGGNAERVVNDEDGARGVPGRVAACFERVADTARGETRGVGFLLHQQFARELLYQAALAVVFDECIVLLGRALGQRLEPVGVVGHALLVGPLLHAFGHGVGDGAVEPRTVVDDIDELFVDVARKILIHLLAVEHVFSKILRRTVGRRSHFLRHFAESLGHDLKA